MHPVNFNEIESVCRPLESIFAALKKEEIVLDQEDFDLEAWKNSAMAILARIFGKDDYRLKQIQDLKIDYNDEDLETRIFLPKNQAIQ